MNGRTGRAWKDGKMERSTAAKESEIISTHPHNHHHTSKSTVTRACASKAVIVIQTGHGIPSPVERKASIFAAVSQPHSISQHIFRFLYFFSIRSKSNLLATCPPTCTIYSSNTHPKHTTRFPTRKGAAGCSLKPPLFVQKAASPPAPAKKMLSHPFDGHPHSVTTLLWPPHLYIQQSL